MKIVKNSVISAKMINTVFETTLLAGLCIFLLLTPGGLKAQNHFSVSSGAGKYDLINVGAQWHFAKKSSLAVHAGSNFGIDDKQLYSVGLSFDQVFFKPVNWKVKPGYSIGAVYWSQDDELYYFETLTFPIMLLAEYPIFPNITLRAGGGIVFSQSIISDRKQNTTAGYPERFDGNFQLSIIYNLNKNEK